LRSAPSITVTSPDFSFETNIPQPSAACVRPTTIDAAIISDSDHMGRCGIDTPQLTAIYNSDCCLISIACRIGRTAGITAGTTGMRALDDAECHRRHCATMNRALFPLTATAVVALMLWPAVPLRADDRGTEANRQQLPTVYIDATAIAGAAIDADKVPGNVQFITASDIARDGISSVTHALNAQLGSISLGDDLDDPFQPDILYRGFEASPVLGTPQGLAVYQNGVRINEAFGDTVNWDLFPDFAIQRVDIVSSSPVYGLNALGGGISIGMKDGFSYHENELELYGGSFGERAGTIQTGVSSDHYAFYLAGRALDQDGWREFSSDSLRQLYAVFSRHGDDTSFDIRYTYADNQLNGQGPAPVQELALDRSLVFTEPEQYQQTQFSDMEWQLHDL
jgi:hypothetical protein